MCGIAGLVSWGDQAILSRMTDRQAHRGPDDRGVWAGAQADGAFVGLGARRLAIMDLSPAGHMPMTTADTRLTVVFNGEIYNYPQLRAELEGVGYRFRSSCDTEVLLYLYEREGLACFRRLNGMFAIAIWDRVAQRMVLARDHFGIKPLYLCQRPGRLAFASEVKALLAVPDIQPQVSPAALEQFLTFLWVPDPLTMFEGIVKLEAGHVAVFERGQLTTRQFWDLRMPPAEHIFGGAADDLRDELRQRFLATVRAQLQSNVPVGSFLSAGLDSSSIVAAMAAAGHAPLRTYTITFPPAQRRGELTMDDPVVARATAAQLGAQHHEIVVEPVVSDLLPRLIWHMDEPVADPALIMAYLVSRAARRDVTVLLSGVGGDELFAGYRRYQAQHLARHYQRLPAMLRRDLLEPLVGRLPMLRDSRLRGYVRLAQKMARSGSLPPHERYLTDCTYLGAAERAALLGVPVAARPDNKEVWARHQAHFAQVAAADPLNQLLYVDGKTFMPSLNLTYTDKMSMASSLEVRVPFLDWELAEWVAWHVPPGLKLRGSTTKHLLREAMRPLLPPAVLAQRKAGFGAPTDAWLTGHLRPLVDDLLSPATVARRGWLSPAAVQRMVAAHRRGQHDFSLQIWALLTFEIWQQVFLDGQAPADPGAGP